jgi:hypothetical protein
MTGYLMRLAVRSTQTGVGLRPRAPSLFEAVPPVLEAASRDAGTSSAPVPTTTRAAPPEPPADSPAVRPASQLHPPPEVDPASTTRIAASAVPPAAAVATAAAASADGVVPARHADPVRTGEHPPAADRPAAVVTSRNRAPTTPLTASTGDTSASLDRLPAPLTVEIGAPSVAPMAPGEPAAPVVALPRLHPRPPSAQPAPEVKVSIGRIEVVAAPPTGPTEAAVPSTAATPPVRATPRRATGAPALADYLRDRSRR